jgi:phytoene dehydrogenase-like protein
MRCSSQRRSNAYSARSPFFGAHHASDDAGGAELAGPFGAVLQGAGSNLVKRRMHNVSLAFASYLQSQGDGIRANAGVEKFLVSSKRVTGVRLQSGEEITVNQIVVSSVDPGQLVLRFLGEEVVGSEIAGKMKR